MALHEVLDDCSEGKSVDYAHMIPDHTMVDVFDEASEPVRAFLRILEDVDGGICVPDEGHPVLCAKVLEVLLDHQRRVITQAVECVNGQVGKVILNAHDHGEANREKGIAGQYCLARILEK